MATHAGSFLDKLSCVAAGREPALIFMPTIKHGLGLKSIARDIAKDVRLHPNKRVLIMLILAHLDGHDWAMDIIKTQFGSSARVAWKETGEQDDAEDLINREAKQRIKEMFGVVEATDGASTADKCSGS